MVCGGSSASVAHSGYTPRLMVRILLAVASPCGWAPGLRMEQTTFDPNSLGITRCPIESSYRRRNAKRHEHTRTPSVPQGNETKRRHRRHKAYEFLGRRQTPQKPHTLRRHSTERAAECPRWGKHAESGAGICTTRSMRGPARCARPPLPCGLRPRLRLRLLLRLGLGLCTGTRGGRPLKPSTQSNILPWCWASPPAL